MTNSLIHGGGYTLGWSRYCPHCQRWFALAKVEEHPELHTVTYRCQHCQKESVCEQKALTDRQPWSPRNLY